MRYIHTGPKSNAQDVCFKRRQHGGECEQRSQLEDTRLFQCPKFDQHNSDKNAHPNCRYLTMTTFLTHTTCLPPGQLQPSLPRNSITRARSRCPSTLHRRSSCHGFTGGGGGVSLALCYSCVGPFQTRWAFSIPGPFIKNPVFKGTVTAKHIPIHFQLPVDRSTELNDARLTSINLGTPTERNCFITFSNNDWRMSQWLKLSLKKHCN